MLDKDDREQIEESIFDAHYAAQKYIESGKSVHQKMLEVSVQDALDLLELLSDKVKDDEMSDNYKLHLLIPLQLVKLLEMRNDT